MFYPLLYALFRDKNGNLAHNHFAAWFLLQMKRKAADATLEQYVSKDIQIHTQKN